MSDRYEWLEQQRAGTKEDWRAQNGYLSAEEGIARAPGDEWRIHGVQARRAEEAGQRGNMHSRRKHGSLTDNEGLAHERSRDARAPPREDREAQILDVKTNQSNCRPLNQKKVMFKLDEEQNRYKSHKAAKYWME